jgi:multidrug resistance efflux pump
MAAPAPRRRSALWIVLVVLVAGGAVWALSARSRGGEAVAATWTVRREDLRISVTEGGSVQALKSHVVTSEVEGETKILSIVPEGTFLTAEDVASGKVLVELDSSALKEKRVTQEITVSEAASNVEQALAALDIQKKKNESDVRKAELDVQFAQIDLDKYVGREVAEKAVAARAGGASDVSALSSEANLGGEALQELRKRQSDIDLVKEELARARDKLKWTDTLLAKGYVSQDEQVADRLALKRQEVGLEQANTALDLYRRYEFPKQVEQLLSNLLEAREALARTTAQAASSLAQAQSVKRGREEKLRLERDRLARLVQQIASCVIRAANPGLVVYASSEERGNWNEGSPIQEGTSVRQRQAIISIPDPKSMGVKVNVHESALQKVKLGQEARIVVDAYPDRVLPAKVVRLSTLPNASNRWQNPDLKVYATDIAFDQAPPELRPGLSAKVEILIDEIEDALAVPLQAVAGSAGKPAVWKRTASGDAPVPVVLGESNDRFVEVKEGVAEGDVVLLAPPREKGAPASERSERNGPASAMDGEKPREGTPSPRPGRGAGGGRRAERGGEGAPAGTPAADAPAGGTQKREGAAPPTPNGGTPPRVEGAPGATPPAPPPAAPAPATR